MTTPRPSTRHAKKFEIIAVPRHGRGVAHHRQSRDNSLGERAAAFDDGNWRSAMKPRSAIWGGATSRAASLGAVREGQAGSGNLVAPPFRPKGSRAVASAI